MNGNLYVNHNGLWFKVDAIFCNSNDDGANDYMEQNENSSVLIANGNVIVLCDKNDKGSKLV
jgi:hypothetical protein